MPSEAFADRELSVPEAIVRILEEVGIDTVFGLPGGETMRIYDALYEHQDTIRCVLAREESLATVMAEVYGRLTGRPGVVIGQGAWLLANGGMGILEAFLGSSPMLVLSDLSDGAPYSQHAPYQAGTGDYGTWKARQAFESFTRRTMVSYSSAEAIQHTQLGIKHALGATPGPVAVLYHSAALKSTIVPGAKPTTYPTIAYLGPQTTAQVPDSASVERVAARLAAAERPVVIAGNGIRLSRCYKALATLADTLGVAVVTTGAGKGVFPENNPLAGGVIGTFGLACANRLVRDADLILAVGTKLSSSDTSNENAALIDPTQQSIIQIDSDPLNISWTYPTLDFLIGDAGTCLGALADSIGRQHQSRRYEAGRMRVAGARESFGYYNVPESESTEVPILPQRLIKALRTALPDDGITTCDAGENRLFMQHFFETRTAGTYLQPASAGGMGYAIPAALAAKLLNPDRAVVAVCGDGGFSMALNGLLTSVEEKLPITVIVMNNRCLGWVFHGQRDRHISSELRDFDYAAIARAMGCEAWRVEDPAVLEETIGRAIAVQAPAVIDVAISAVPNYRTVAWRPT